MTYTKTVLGDCVEKMADIPSGSISAVICDPPYGLSNNIWDVPLPLQDFWKELDRVTLKCSPMLVFSAQPYATDMIQSNRKNFRYDLIWHKTKAVGFLNANRQPLRAHELVLCFYRKAPNFYPQKTQGHPRKTAIRKPGVSSINYSSDKLGTSYDSTERFPTSVLTYGRGSQKKGVHPTQKPIQLLRFLVKSYTRPGDIILDPCAGSGSTGVACVLENRSCHLIEIDPRYKRAMDKRLAKAWSYTEGDELP